MAITAGRGGAPGSFIYESAAAAQTLGSATFNTSYMMVEAPAESSVVTFPYNRPISLSTRLTSMRT